MGRETMTSGLRVTTGRRAFGVILVGMLLTTSFVGAQTESEGRDAGERPERPATAVQPSAVTQPSAAAQASEEVPAALAAEAPETEVELPVLETDGAINLTFSRGSDRRPAFSPDGRWIAFESDRDGQWEIYRMRIDGTHQERLTNHPAADRSPWYSPDGRYLAFQSNRRPGDRRSDLYLLDLELDETIAISEMEADEAFPRFSPDGRWLVFTASPDGNSDLFALPMSGSPPVPGPVEQLTDHEANDLWGSWSSDSKSLVFYSQRDGNDEVYRMDFETREVERITTHSANDFVPTLSPDGAWIAYGSNREGAGLTRILLLEVATGAISQLAEEHWAAEPVFSPDGRHLAFVSNRARANDIHLWELP